jgi:serine protease Do
MVGRWLLPVFVITSACGRSDTAQAQTRDQTRAEVREQLGGVPGSTDTATAAALSGAFRGAAARALPAVVYVAVEQDARMAGARRDSDQLPIPEEFRRFFQMPEGQMPDQGPQLGNGSGFIIDAQGRIITNHHVVQNASRVTVRLVDGREYTAEVLGSDANTDVAVIKINPRQGEQLPVIGFADSDALKVGDWVLALGNPLGFDFTVTAGIVSAKGRRITGSELPIESFIQTDAAINMGNSGGPLVDLLGQVVGVNTAIAGGGNRFVGYGFAVPINLARKAADDIIKYGYARRPKLGVRVSDVSSADAEVYKLPEVRGAEIASVEQGSPAAQAGLQVGDVVFALNGTPLRSGTDLTAGLGRMEPGDPAKLTIYRNGQPREITVRLGEFERPDTRGRVAAPTGDRSEQLLGFSATALTPRIAQQLEIETQTGVVISNVQPGSPAQLAGVRQGLVILQVNGQAVRRPEDVGRIAGQIRPGEVVSLRVRAPDPIGETIINYRTRQ